MTPRKDHVKTLVTTIGSINAIQIPFLEASLNTINDDEQEFLNNYIDFCIEQGITINYLAKCYNAIVKDTLREQIYFQKHKRYRHSSYNDVEKSVYNNDEYMKLYMHGLALTSILWPNHRNMRRFFLSMIPRHAKGKYLEIGPGHGVYLMTAMQLTSYDLFEAIDISATSIELTSKILKSNCFGNFTNYTLLSRDFLTSEMTHHSYDSIVMGEVLEHVEEPLNFLKKIHSITTKESFIYITTCINAPAIDHIYLFDSISSIHTMVNEASLTIKDELLVPYEGCSLDDSLEKRLPVNIALVLENR